MPIARPLLSWQNAVSWRRSIACSIELRRQRIGAGRRAMQGMRSWPSSAIAHRALLLTLLAPVALLSPAQATRPDPALLLPAPSDLPAAAPTGIEGIKVVDARYGRPNSLDFCDAKPKIVDLCQNHTRCSVAVGPTLCGAAPAPLALIAALSVQFRCRLGDKLQTVSVEKPFVLRLSCGMVHH
jgi:hypothetical protein